MANLNISISWDDGTNLNISAAAPPKAVLTDAMVIVESIIEASQAVQTIPMEDTTA